MSPTPTLAPASDIRYAYRDPKLPDVLDPDPATNARLHAWRPAYDINSDVDAFLFRQLVAYSLGAEHALDEERALLHDLALQAEHDWDAPRRLDAAKLGSRLARDPETIALRLRQTLQGCHWLLARWAHLASLLEKGHAWTPAQRRLALDLAGTPADLRDPDHTIPSPAALALQETAALTALRDGPLATLEAHARASALKGIALSPSRALLAARRRHATFTRLYHATRKLLSPVAPPEPALAPDPIPTPHRLLPAAPPPSPTLDPAPRPGVRLTGSLTGTHTMPNRRARRAARTR